MRLIACLLFAASLQAQWLSVVGGGPVAAPPACSTQADNQTGSAINTDLTGYSSPYVWLAIPFTPGSSYTLCSLKVPANKTGSPTFTLHACIYTSSSGTPGSLIGTCSGEVNASGLTGSLVSTQFTGLSAAVTSGTPYFVVFVPSASGGASNYAGVGTAGSGSVAAYNSANGSSWSFYSATNTAIITTYK